MIHIINIGGGANPQPEDDGLIFHLGIVNNEIKDLTGNHNLTKIRNPQVVEKFGVKCIDLNSGAFKIERPHRIRKAWIDGNLRIETKVNLNNVTGQSFFFGSCRASDHNVPATLFSDNGQVCFTTNNTWTTYSILGVIPNDNKFHEIVIDMSDFSVNTFLDGTNSNKNVDNYSNHGEIRGYEVLIGEQTAHSGSGYIGRRSGYMEYLKIYNKSLL